MSSTQHPSSAPFVQSSVADRITEQIPGSQSIKQSTTSGLETARQQVPSTQPAPQQPSSAPFAQSGITDLITEQIPSAQSIKGTASSGLEAARQQLPSTQQVSDQLPTVQGTTGTLKQGANYVSEGIKGLALGASNITPPKVTTQKPADPGDLHIPGAFDDELPVTPQETSTVSTSRQSSVLPAQSSKGTAQHPAHAGAGSGIPRDTVESSAEPDVSYEHRPKTLPQSEIVGREKERGLREGHAAAPERVAASRRGAHWDPEATGSAEAVHEKSEVEKELLSKVQETPAGVEAIATGNHAPASGGGNAVVGNWGSETAGRAVSGTTQKLGDSSTYNVNKGSHPSGSGLESKSTIQPASALHKHTSPGHVDLAAGVQNGIIGPGHDAYISDGPLALPKYEHEPSQSAKNSRPIAGQPIHIDNVKPEFGAGVHNGVVGSGSRPA